MVSSHGINSHEINSHKVNSHEVNSNQINFPRDQFLGGQLNVFMALIKQSFSTTMSFTTFQWSGS